MEAILEQGLQELEINADEKQLGLLLSFIKLIEKWNKTYNLTALHTAEDMARLHILDSLTVLPFIEGHRVADIGTGAGLPGIPLAIFLPNVKFTLVDSSAKKTRFVQQAIIELKLKNVTVLHNRVENLRPTDLFSTVIMRAFSNLSDIINLTQHLIEKQGLLLAMKGQKPVDELDQIKQPYSVIPVTVPGVKVERCLILIKGLAENG